MRSTPHINPTAPIAETILLPGDPLRAKFIAENYLEDVQQFNAVRNMLGFTGTYQGTPVSVMGTGMGIPSISLYSYELIHEFGCKRLVRVGTCGALQSGVNLYDVVVAQAAWLELRVPRPVPAARLLRADRLLPPHRGRGAPRPRGRRAGPRRQRLVLRHVLQREPDVNEAWQRMGVLAVEMETAGLYATAAHAGVEALGIFTVSDSLVTGEATDAQARQTSFTTMMELALPLATL